MAIVLAQWVLKLMRGSIYVASAPFFVAFVSKDPSVENFLFDDEDACIPDKYDVDLGRAALIRNNDVSEFEELEVRLYRFEPNNRFTGGRSNIARPPTAAERACDEQTDYD
jgi:hypothetical protein